jgi:hypothetical protein
MASVSELEAAWGKTVTAGPGSDNPYIRQQLVSASSDLLGRLQELKEDFEKLRVDLLEDSSEIEKEADRLRRLDRDDPTWLEPGSNDSQDRNVAVDILRDMADATNREQRKSLTDAVENFKRYVSYMKHGRYL